MAILFRTITALTVGGMSARLTVYAGTSRIRVELAPYAEDSGTVYTGALEASVTYNGVTETLSANPFTGAVSAAFGFVPEVKELTLSSASGIGYGGTSSGTCTFSWKGDGTVPVPELAVSSYSGLMKGQPSRVEWSVGGVPAGHRAYTIGVWLGFAETMWTKTTYTRSELVTERTAAQVFEHTMDGLEAQNALFYRIAVGLYPEDGAENAGREDYVSYAEIDTPVYVCSGSSIYTLTPCNLRWGTVQKNRAFTIRWDLLAAATATGGVKVDYCHDGETTWYSMYDGTADSCSFTVTKDWKTIQLRIAAYSTRSKHEVSAYLYGRVIEIGTGNVYVGYSGSIVPAAEVRVGSGKASPVLYVG